MVDLKNCRAAIRNTQRFLVAPVTYFDLSEEGAPAI